MKRIFYKNTSCSLLLIFLVILFYHYFFSNIADKLYILLVAICSYIFKVPYLPDCIVKMTNALVRIHVASSQLLLPDIVGVGVGDADVDAVVEELEQVLL